MDTVGENIKVAGLGLPNESRGRIDILVELKGGDHLRWWNRWRSLFLFETELLLLFVLRSSHLGDDLLETQLFLIWWARWVYYILDCLLEFSELSKRIFFIWLLMTVLYYLVSLLSLVLRRLYYFLRFRLFNEHRLSRRNNI